MTLLHLVRHGQHSLQGKVLVGRSAGVHLSERGRAEAARAAGWLARQEIAAIYCSPLERACETAEIIARRVGMPFAIVEDAVEVEFGEWTGLTVEALRAHPAWPGEAARQGVTFGPGGEPPLAVQSRCVALAETLHARHPEEAIVLVGHGDPILSVLAHALGMPLDRIGDLEVSTGSISTVAFHPGRRRVMRVNLTPEAEATAEEEAASTIPAPA
jgi:probable phosphoglycerate mutase